MFQCNLNNKTSSWIKTTKEVLHKNSATLKYKDMSKEHKVLQELLQECFLPKGGGTDTLSLDHKVFLYFLVMFEKVNMPRYIFNHMVWALKGSQQVKRRYIPYGRLLSEIFYHGKLLNVLRSTGVVSDDHLRTVTGKVFNGRTLRYMQLCEKYDKLETDMHESKVVSDLTIDFPLITKQDNPEVLVSYVTLHFEMTGEIINYSSIPETQGGVPLKVASKMRKSKKAASKSIEVSEPRPKKQKEARRAPQMNVIEHALPTIQEEIVELKPVEVLGSRTRGVTSEVVPTQSRPRIQRKKRTVRKMKVSQYVVDEDAEVEMVVVGSLESLTTEQKASMVEKVVKLLVK